MTKREPSCELEKELLEEKGVFVVRNGDDLMIEGRKLSVSIATKSITSVLIHTGLNILSEGAPVAACGLESELKISNMKEFAEEIMQKALDNNGGRAIDDMTVLVVNNYINKKE